MIEMCFVLANIAVSESVDCVDQFVSAVERDRSSPEPVGTSRDVQQQSFSSLLARGLFLSAQTTVSVVRVSRLVRRIET